MIWMVPAAYGAACLATARMLYGRWRPARTPVRCVTACRAAHGGLHDVACYQQQRKDLTRVGLDTDFDACMAAMLAALIWPVLVLVVAVTACPRELKAERMARERREKKEAEERKERLQARIGDLEQSELGET